MGRLTDPLTYGLQEGFTTFKKGVFHLSLHANSRAWLNQVELWFGILSKRVLRHGSFENADELVRIVDAFAEPREDVVDIVQGALPHLAAPLS
jgi:hypothetical protein